MKGIPVKVVKSYLRVNIETEFFSSAQKMAADFENYDRLETFPKNLLARTLTLFQCVSLWRESQSRQMTHATREEIDKWTEGGFETLLAAKIIEPSDDIFEIVGNEKQLESIQTWREHKSKAGKAGAAKRWKKNKELKNVAE